MFLKKQVINPNEIHYLVCGFDMLIRVFHFTNLEGLPIKLDMFFF
jgi:hypothetical protein